MTHGGDVVARQLAVEDVDILFTLTGGHISPIYDGARKLGIRLVDMRHEQAVAHAADALARLRRRPAAAAVTAGPGVTGALTGIANADAVGRNRAVARGIVSDVRAFLRELMKLDGQWAGAAGGWLAELRDLESAAAAERRKALESDRVPIHPMRLVGEVAAFLDEDAVVIGDGGDIVAMTASVVRAGRPGHWLDPGPFGCLGVGAPFAIAARLARPGKQVLAMSGDGSFGFNGMEYDSAVRQRLPFAGVVGNNGAWGEMRTFHEDVFGPEHLEAQYLSQQTRYDRLVEALGGFGQRVVEPSEIRPALVDVVLDPKYRRPAKTISGRHVAAAFGGGDPLAFRTSNR